MQTDSVRVAAVADTWFNYSKQNEDYVVSASLNGTVQLKSRDLKSIFFLLGNYSLVSTQNQDYRNAWLVHLRFNRKLSQLLRAEAFLQHQRNKLLVIDTRFLAGAGIRLKVLDGSYLSAYLGQSAMYEIESSTDFDQQSHNWRHNAYASLSFSPAGGKVVLTNTLYFQPLYRALGNHRILEQFKLEVPVSRVISLSGSYDYYLLSVTPSGARDMASNLYFGLSFSL
ncbi:DUF481 domain-containing protein [Robiginitalea sp. M366]|uniref:DUF481 domain-containing protein n=1 Tax=Robiginitalea aestuariiviva TaxID=3036903 RepID=UPI00240E9570|nr:DUF481 domain-containing protein [Robiginitalea aestuariiviva]MDG1570964.1 DUF481 domain-containing protein [Robiginitalea aestuariiviva]